MSRQEGEYEEEKEFEVQMDVTEAMWREDREEQTEQRAMKEDDKYIEEDIEVREATRVVQKQDTGKTLEKRDKGRG